MGFGDQKFMTIEKILKLQNFKCYIVSGEISALCLISMFVSLSNSITNQSHPGKYTRNQVHPGTTAIYTAHIGNMK